MDFWNKKMSKVISLGQILFLDLPYEITVDNKISTAAQEDLLVV